MITDYIELRKKIIEKDFDRLNPEQKKAVFSVDGPLLILAGAGSGKTTVLVNRIANIIKYGKAYYSDYVPPFIDDKAISFLNDYYEGRSNDHNLASMYLAVEAPKPWQMLAITFTNKAAQEMKDRLGLVVGDGAEEIWASTFHSACTRILRRYADRLGYTSHFTIYDTDDSKRAMKQVQRMVNIDDKVLSHKLILSEISHAKDSLIDCEEYAKTAQNDVRRRMISQSYTEYQNLLKQSDAMDFDDIIFNCVKLLRQEPDVLEHYQRQFKYVLVDEYQDTNHAQYVLTSLLAGGYKNICVVGDDDQSIYRFRGATVENIMEFENQYDNALVIRLEQNYRSTSTILDAANKVIENNEHRKGKSLWTAGDKGDKITVHTAANEREEGEYIADTIMDAVKEGKKWSDHAVLYRMNALSANIERSFVKMGVPYRVIGGFRFYERKEIKDAIAYLCVINNFNDDIRLRRIINEPKRGIGETTVNNAMDIARGLGISLFEVLDNAEQYEKLYRSASKLKSFTQMIKSLNALVDEIPLKELFEKLMEQTGYINSLSADMDTFEERSENLNELASSLVTFSEDVPGGTLTEFLEEVALMTDIDNYDKDSDSVVLMTLHSAKGLEFNRVFIVGMEEGIFPGRQSMYDEREVEEERRLAYVGITRAREKLYLTKAQSRMVYGSTNRNRQSRFVDEIPNCLVETSGVSYLTTVPPKPVATSAGQARRMSPVQVNRSYGQTVKSNNTDVFNVGDRVKHKAFGEGMIISTSAMGGDVLLEIAFDTVGTKRLMGKFARLTKI